MMKMICRRPGWLCLVLIGWMIGGGAGLSTPAEATPPLNLMLTVTSTNVAELASITVTMTVKNTTAATIPDVYPSALEVAGTGAAALTKWPAPTFASIPAGGTAKFTVAYKAMLSGTLTFSGVALSSTGNSLTNFSPVITVNPKTIGLVATTDDYGKALLKVGNATLPIQIIDEDTGSAIAGLSIGLALDKTQKGRAVLAIADSLGRYEVQTVLLQGASANTPAAMAIPQTLTPPLPVQSFHVSSRPGCAPDNTYSHVALPVTTPALPPLVDVPSPTPVTESALAAITAALSAAADQTLKATVDSQTISCQDALQDDLNELLAQPVEQKVDAWFEEPAAIAACLLINPAAEEVCPALVERVGLAKDLVTVVDAAKDVGDCGINPSDDLMLQRVTFLPGTLDTVLYQTLVSPTETLPELVHVPVTATDSYGIPLSSGSLELVSSANLGSGFQAIVADGGVDAAVPVDDYYWTVRSPGYQPQCGQVSVTATGAAINTMLQPQPIVSGNLTTDQLTGFLPQGTQFTVTPHFFDTNGNEVACSGTVVYSVHNPVGTVVATVDQNTGVVTMQGGCGAAGITAWCNGVETIRKLVSSDCNGTEPPPSKSNFVVSPTSLTFTAMQNGSNPPDQPVYIFVVQENGLTYDQELTRTWMAFGAHGSDYDYYGVNISGLNPGTYSGDILYTDVADSNNTATVKVTLIIQPQPTANVAGVWSGTYSFPIDDVGDEAEFSVVWDLNQSGANVSGTYGQIESGSSQQENGSMNDGHVEGDSLTIYNDGGLEFDGTVSGSGGTSNITGTVFTGALNGSFSVTKQ
jgi:hypothetical protein